MKKVRGLVSVLLSASMLVSMAACGGDKFEDYYTFDTSSVTSELLYGSSMKIEPVIRNLGKVVDADYSVKVMFDGEDVTSDVYNAQTRTFAPAEQTDAIGLYTFTLTVLDEDGNEVKNENGETFSTTFTVDYCIMNFVPKASAGAGVSVDNADPLSPVISFGENYTGDGLNDSGQYRVTGVNFSGDYEIVYKVRADAIGSSTDTRFHFGVDRTDENKRDDNIALNVEDGTLSAWFFDDNGTASGSDWTGTGWISTEKSVSNYQSLANGSEHLIGFTRIVNEASGNAHYVVTWDGEYFTSLNIKGNWTDTVGGVWVESQNVQGSIGIESFRQLETDTQAPTLQLHYDDMGVGSSVDLMDGIVIEDNIYDAYDTIEWTVTSPDGEDVTPSNGVLQLTGGGVYTVTAVVTDLKGNVSQKATAAINVYSDFAVKGIGFDRAYKAGVPVTLNVTFTSDDAAMKDATSVRILKDGADTGTSVTGNADTGFTFTLSESGVYTAEVSTVSAGKPIVKMAEFAVSGAQAGEIDISQNTSAARTLVSHILYAEAWDLFTAHPVLGVGLGFYGDNFAINTMQFYWFHSTLFQVLANMGLVGLAAYIFYYVARFRTIRRLRNPFNLFTLVAWLGFEGYSMMDTGTFVPFPTMTLVLVTAGIAELVSSRPQFKGEADSYNRTFARTGVPALARKYDSFTPAYVREVA